jgi:hypothetical protein
MANVHEAIANACQMIAIPSGNLSGGADAKLEAILVVLEVLTADFAEFRTKTIAELDELKDQLADTRADG